MLYSLTTTPHVGPQVYKTGSNSLTKIFIASLKNYGIICHYFSNQNHNIMINSR